MARLMVGLLLAVGLAQARSAAQAPSPAPAHTPEALVAAGRLEGAADAYRALLDGGTADRARTLYQLADVERRLARPDAAEGHAREAADLFRHRSDAEGASRALNLAGMAATSLGHYPAAAAHFTSAMGLSAPAHAWEAHAEQISNLGTVYFLVGQYDEADRTFERALVLAGQHGDEPWAASRRVIVLANQAALLQRLGRYPEALALYGAMRRPDTMVPAHQLAQVLVNQGALFRRLGDPYKALDTYDAARRRFAAADDRASEAAVLTNRGIALALDLERYDDAANAFSEAVRVAEAASQRREALLAGLYRGEAWRRAGRLDLARQDFAAARDAATALGSDEEHWKALYGLGRIATAEGRRPEARATLDQAIAVVDGLRERLGVPSTRAEFFQDKREVYDARIAVGLGLDTAGETFSLIERSRARAWRDRLALPAVTLDDTQARLADGTVLLAYWTSDVGSAVVRVTRGDARVLPITVDLDRIRALDAALRRPGGDEWRMPATELGRTLLPEGVLEGATRMVVVPDGPLGVVPFDALVIEGAPLLARATVSVVPTAGALGATRSEARRWLPPWTPTLAAFGDPWPGDGPSGEGADTRLPASAAEVRAIAATLGGRHQLFLGAENRKDALLAVLRSPPLILHLATHAVADLALGERSRLAFSPPAAGGPAESLFLREIYALPLAGVDLAVLSACETERGPEVRGEGVQGFSRAFIAAGARRTLTTLWRVPDQSTAALMRLFYQELQAGQPLDLALARAQRTLARAPGLSHPHYWAAFVVTGPVDPVPTSPRWRSVFGAGLIVAGVVGAIGALVRHRSSSPRP